MTDSTIAPPQTRDFLLRMFHARSIRGSMVKWYIVTYFLVREGSSTDDVGVAKGNVIREKRSWTGLKTGDFGEEKMEWLS